MFAPSRARAQACDLLEVWVDPARGVDLGAPSDSNQVGDKGNPCKSIQFAIHKLYENLSKLYASDPVLYADWQGIVYCMPGLYGPHGALSSGDKLPIEMKDRVHVQGVNARACVIRGTLRSDVPSDAGSYAAFWPTNNAQPPYAMRASQVLVTFRESSQYSYYPTIIGAPIEPPTYDLLPSWVGTGETAERLDGFTFQGGDIQVLFATHPHEIVPMAGPVLRAHPLAGRVSHCVFDMRHAWPAVWRDGQGAVQSFNVRGPTFGLLVTPNYTPAGSEPPYGGYFSFDVMAANNTFVMVERELGVWRYECLTASTTPYSRNAVALCDVTDPGLYHPFALPAHPPQWADPLRQYRGLSRLCVLNNVFRTRPTPYPSNSGPMAMLGIDSEDCSVRASVLDPYRQTNAFVAGRAAASNVSYVSTPVPTSAAGVGAINVTQNLSFSEPLYNCHASTAPVPPPCAASTTLPAPAVRLWDGTSVTTPQMYDPMFVGEYLVNLVGSGVDSNYRDWRILPTSPLIDAGFYGEPLDVEHRNVAPYEYDSDCSVLRTFDRDGEGYGNPHPGRDPIDIGFDEYQMLIVAGSWTNDSIVHNDNTYPAAVLQPSALSSGFSQRHLILHERYAGYPLTVHGTLNPTSAGGPGWVEPIGSLTSPVIDPTAGFEHRRRYISYTSDPVPPPATNPTMPWNVLALQSIAVPTYVGVPGAWWGPATHWICRVVHPDSECAASTCAHEYFNMQAVVEGYPSAASRHHSNLQNDYR